MDGSPLSTHPAVPFRPLVITGEAPMNHRPETLFEALKRQTLADADKDPETAAMALMMTQLGEHLITTLDRIAAATEALLAEERKRI